MPRAAFCSRCGTYQWVNADGTCANGHPAECLTDHHEVPVPGYAAGPAVDSGEVPIASRETRVRPRWVPSPLGVLLIGAFALSLVMVASGITLATHTDNVSSAMSQIFGPTTDDSVAPDALSADEATDTEDTSVNATVDTSPLPDVPSTPEHVALPRTNTNPNVAAPALDAFIAKQYPC